MDANRLRRTFTQYFVDRGHNAVSSAGLIPHHPAAPLFTNAGMNQFLSYFLGEEAAPFPRATSVQKCVRIRGKHDDIELIGRTTRHHTFFEMLGNFSFGDYFKEGAIKFHWELCTEALGIDGDRIWVTVHHDDDVAAEIWRDTIGVPPERIQRMGEDNFWEMGESGPCGPCSELYFDKGAEFGEGGGPLNGGEERFMEFGNLVFMEFDRQPDGKLEPLPRQNIDTGSGFERILSFLQNQRSVWETDVIRPLIATAEALSGRKYGDDPEDDVSMRIMADHARAMTFLVSDGVFPSNEDRGYVLRRIVRRMLRHASRIGADRDVAAQLTKSVVDVMSDAYGELNASKDLVVEVLSREEHRFRQTIQAGSALLDSALESSEVVSGATAFKLHDTYGFPIELTTEIVAERGKTVDTKGFESAMEQARRTARERAKGVEAKGISVETYREIIDLNGPTEFVGYGTNDVEARVVAVLPVADSPGEVEIFLTTSPFYAEQGGQVGDTGNIKTETGMAVVTDTTWAIPGLIRHSAEITSGSIESGQEARASIDVSRRAAIRRNHTGTHILHWALREVLGQQVKQAGSLVAPDRLRFDFSHFSAVSHEELAEIERLANSEILSGHDVEIIETTKEEALAMGAIAFFGEKYGERVRMLKAGANSLELCGGTHVSALGDIGFLKIVSESSIGSNLRRIEAVTGFGALDFVAAEEESLRAAAGALKVKPANLAESIERSIEKQKQLEDEVKRLQAIVRASMAETLADEASEGALVKRVDGVATNELRDLALTLRDKHALEAVVFVGSPDGKSVALVSTTKKGGVIDAAQLISRAAKLAGGGGGKGHDVAMAGGRNVEAIDDALDAVNEALSSVRGSAANGG